MEVHHEWGVARRPRYRDMTRWRPARHDHLQAVTGEDPVLWLQNYRALQQQLFEGSRFDVLTRCKREAISHGF